MNQWKFDYQKKAIYLIGGDSFKATSFESITEIYDSLIKEKRVARHIGYLITIKNKIFFKTITERMLIFNFDDSSLIINFEKNDNEIVTDKGHYNVDINVIDKKKTIITFSNEYEESFKFFLINQHYLIAPQNVDDLLKNSLIKMEIVL